MVSDWSLSQTYQSSFGTVKFDACGEGPPLVVVHGTPWSSYNWRNIIPVLAEHRTVYFYDLLGYGQSEKAEAVSLGIQNPLLAELLDHWGLQTPDIVGHDFGGTTVLRTHLLSNRNFRKLAVIDPVAIAPWGSPFFRLVAANEAVFQKIPGNIHEAMVTAYIRTAMYQQPDATVMANTVAPWLGEAGQQAFYRQIAQSHQHFTDEIEPCYGDIKPPVLILWGAEDTWIPIERGQQLHAKIPHSEFHAIEKAGHLVLEEAPTTIAQKLVDFFIGAKT
ncbi:MAG: alpha/beta hydrolase [Cyanobacteria bacterium P01_A01_bin.123]